MISETVEIREGNIAMVWASQGIASIMPVAGIPLEPLHKLIHQVVSEEKSPADLQSWLDSVSAALDNQDSAMRSSPAPWS